MSGEGTGTHPGSLNGCFRKKYQYNFYNVKNTNKQTKRVCSDGEGIKYSKSWVFWVLMKIEFLIRPKN